jgi:eukaryotic-like serine/threonine-protein kinase
LPTRSAPTVPIKDLESGEVLDGAWRLEALIGQGGMGRVFRATDLKLGRNAAVKVLSINNIDDETVKRFEREAQVMGKLRHRGVVTLYTYGRTHGVPWLAMQYLEGRSLWKVLQEQGGHIAPEVLLPIARQLLTTLAYIHNNKLLHRDLKPSNIHIGPAGQATLLDLGLARGHKSSITRTGVVWGTPDYMAPEQIAGERELDGRADLYALSVVLYRMLSGKPPFGTDEDNELMRAHMTKPRPDVSRVMPNLSLLLGAALQKGLAIHPEDRFQSAEEMLAALEKAMVARARDAPTTARPRASGPRAKLTEPLPVAPASEGARTAPLENAVRDLQADIGTIPLQAAIKRLTLEDDEPDSARTQVERFVPLVAPSPEPPVGSGTLTDEDELDSVPGERTTVPSAAAAPTVQPPLPAYLSPGYLIGGALLLLALGVVLGKLL